jgi:hypothetical protein
MDTKPPKPVCKAFLFCRQITQDQRTKETSLQGLTRYVMSSVYPTKTVLALFARWTSAHGDYQLELQLQDLEGNVLWREVPPTAWPMNDPLQAFDLILHNLEVEFPAAGKYDMVLLANGEEIIRDSFFAHRARERVS